MTKKIIIIYLLVIELMNPAFGSEATTGCCCSCWPLQPKVSITLPPPFLITEKKTEMAEKPISFAPKKEEHALLYVGEITTDDDYQNEILYLEQKTKTVTHLVLYQKDFVEDDKYGIHNMYKDLAASWQNIVSLHFIIKNDSSIDYDQMAASIESTISLDKLQSLCIDAPYLLTEKEFKPWCERISSKLPNLINIKVNSAVWNRLK
jgi:hypothetical protein